MWWITGPRDANATVNGDCNAKVAQNQALVSILPNPGHLPMGLLTRSVKKDVVFVFEPTVVGVKCQPSTEAADFFGSCTGCFLIQKPGISTMIMILDLDRLYDVWTINP